MPLYLNTATDVVVDLPETIGDHPVLGRDLILYLPEECEYEEDKVVVEGAHSTQRLQNTAKPTAPTSSKDKE